MYQAQPFLLYPIADCVLNLALQLYLLPHQCREYPDMEEAGGTKYKLALHCGGCMIDSQKMRARIADMEDAGVPVTNYGLFLSWVQSPAALKRVLEPWGVKV